ncbi:MAG TPA: hypothetical protein VIK13_08235 [Candidatus Limnocylindrales bacterium]
MDDDDIFTLFPQATIDAIVARDTAASGVPATVEDELTLRRVARIFGQAYERNAKATRSGTKGLPRVAA